MAVIPFILLSLAACCAAGQTLYEGRISPNYTSELLDASTAPFTTVVKGSKEASEYDLLLGTDGSTPLWAPQIEQVVRITIDNTSVFLPGNNAANAQFGFRRTELIAQSPNRSAFEIGTTVFHVSIKEDPCRPLNYTHEYQIVFIEPDDGTHVFEVQLGTPFSKTTATSLDPTARNLKIRDHALNLLYQTPFKSNTWHNIAVQVDWESRTLAVLYSADDSSLKSVTGVVDNNSTASGTLGQGDYHWGVLKMPLVNPNDSPENQADVVHHGIQEGTTEALLYSGVFVEDVSDGISVGGGKTIPKITSGTATLKRMRRFVWPHF